METTTQISQLYVSIFNRAVEGDGITTWSSLLDQGKSIAQIADLMLATTDAKNYFGTSLDTDLDFVKHIYSNTLNKTYQDDKTGIDSWTQAIKSGTMTRGEAVDSIIQAIADWSVGGKYAALADAKTQEAALQFNNRVEASNYMAQNVPIHSKDYATQTSFSADLPVTYDNQTLQSAKETILSIAASRTNTTISDISTSATTGVSSLLSSSYWSSEKTTITYSFNTYIPSDYYSYPNQELTKGWHQLNSAQQIATNKVMQDASQYLNTKLQEVSSGGDIQLNILDMAPNTAGFSFLPGSSHDYDGDMFLTTDFYTKPQEYGLNVGEFGYTTILHELGHALGLKHPFEGANQLSTAQDDINHTLMSYTYKNEYVPVLSFSSSKIFIDYLKLEPYSYSLYDIEALQSIYGANTTTNADDTTYTLSYSDNKLFTIWDAGGADTIDLSNTTGKNTIDLRGGTLNSVDEKTLAEVIKIDQDIATLNSKSQHNQWIADTITNLYNSNNLYTGTNNLGIVKGTVIENILTGSANDTITDNEVNNTILTAQGNDKIYIGNGGYDTIDGGQGTDTLYINQVKTDISITSSGNDYLLKADNFGALLIGIEHIVLNDGVTYTPDMLLA